MFDVVGLCVLGAPSSSEEIISCPASRASLLFSSLLSLTSKLRAGCIKRCFSPVRAHRDFLRLRPETRSHSPAEASGDEKDMKPVPLLLLLSSVLLSSHLGPAAGRPRSLPGRMDDGGRLRAQRLEELLLRADPSDLLLRRLLQRSSREPLLLLPEEEEEEEVRKRSEEPPLSIDLTFHLLRNMIQMAKMESQREQAQLNRKVLDEVGK